MTFALILSFLTALLGAVMKFWPDKKSAIEISQDRQKAGRDADEKFRKTGDTTDLGKLD